MMKLLCICLTAMLAVTEPAAQPSFGALVFGTAPAVARAEWDIELTSMSTAALTEEYTLRGAGTYRIAVPHFGQYLDDPAPIDVRLDGAALAPVYRYGASCGKLPPLTAGTVEANLYKEVALNTVGVLYRVQATSAQPMEVTLSRESKTRVFCSGFLGREESRDKIRLFSSTGTSAYLFLFGGENALLSRENCTVTQEALSCEDFLLEYLCLAEGWDTVLVKNVFYELSSLPLYMTDTLYLDVLRERRLVCAEYFPELAQGQTHVLRISRVIPLSLADDGQSTTLWLEAGLLGRAEQAAVTLRSSGPLAASPGQPEWKAWGDGAFRREGTFSELSLSLRADGTHSAARRMILPAVCIAAGAAGAALSILGIVRMLRRNRK